MKPTIKQKKEIDFLIKQYNVKPTVEEVREYILQSVHGKGTRYDNSSRDNNPLLLAKRKLDMNIKMWREDLMRGLLSADELKDDFNCEYGNKLVDSIIKSVTKEYRMKLFEKDKTATVLAITNFPDIIDSYKEQIKELKR